MVENAENHFLPPVSKYCKGLMLGEQRLTKVRNFTGTNPRRALKRFELNPEMEEGCVVIPIYKRLYFYHMQNANSRDWT